MPPSENRNESFQEFLQRVFDPNTFRENPPEQPEMKRMQRYLSGKMSADDEAKVVELISTYREWHLLYCAAVLNDDWKENELG